ncbi:MAG: tRNA lysidine(34) synthetase TilS [Acidobacteriota bacterium]|nr:tRNA lysidine(34) synthetase TilS [Acidobacteriota bacterium]MDE3223303.1 tRNA lysidine(34) synthetase TilS [Acidobacteriota bacterium]
MSDADALLAICTFPVPGSAVDLAVSGGPDSMGLLLLARARELSITVHHVNHHARHEADEDASFVADYARAHGLAYVGHDVHVEPGPNFEARARQARRGALPAGALTGHTMDDLVETIVLNLLRGAGVDGLTPMIGDATKPLLGVRRAALHDFVRARGVQARHDATNDDVHFRRNRVRHELLAVMNEVAERDVVPVVARGAAMMHDERRWLDALTEIDARRALEEVDCRELATWPLARLRRWLRGQLAADEAWGDRYPPSADEVARALDVVFGRVTATELRGGRRLARRSQHLRLEEASTTLTSHG